MDARGPSSPVRCSHCLNPAVVEQRYAGVSLCRAHFLESFRRRAHHELARQGGLPDGVTAVALSGGKDSVALLHFLHETFARHPRITLAAVTVDEGIAGYRPSSLEICRELTSRLGMEWKVVRTRDLAGYDIDAYAGGRAGPEGEPLPMVDRPSCGPCGVYRRTGINRGARDLGAVAVATGHNLDDTAQSILMNHLKGDVERLARLAPHDGGMEGLVPRRMPFRSIPEKEVLLYTVLLGLPTHDEECPYAARSHRFETRRTLMDLEARTPGTRHALVAGQDKLQPIVRANYRLAPANACTTCGEPTTGAKCMACVMHA